MISKMLFCQQHITNYLLFSQLPWNVLEHSPQQQICLWYVFYLHNIAIRMNASKHYSMQASHNELSSAILQRYVLDSV